MQRLLRADHPGESHHPMWYKGRVYFITDRDGVMNIWSMDENGHNLQQHTRHTEFDVRYANESNGIIVYQIGADLWKYDISANKYNKINITLATDLDQLREKWEEKPSNYITSVHPDSKGERIAITARGRIFVVPVKSGRIVSFTQKNNVRYRDAAFSHDDKQLIALSDESGEFEFVSMPANGLGSQKEITTDGEVLRYEGVPSPDGKWIAFTNYYGLLHDLDWKHATQKVDTLNTIAALTFFTIRANSSGVRAKAWSGPGKSLCSV